MAMTQNESKCRELVNSCKQEAKQLVEFNVTRRKLHWSHPSFISFCVSVEDVLSYGIRRRYRAGRSKQLTSSGKVLQELSRSLPDAATVYDKCFKVTKGAANPEDYVLVQSSSLTERRIRWLRVAIVEGRLQAIVQSIMESPDLYYTEQSVLCHPVYGEIFCYLLDGPCAIRFSRLKSSDAVVATPSPAEIIARHNKVNSISVTKPQQDPGGPSATEEAWHHVQSLYQNTSSLCLFGKNNVLIQPPGQTEPLRGYLSLQRSHNSLELKWIPNELLKDTADSSLWDHVLSLEMNNVAHVHCHRSPGQSAELILIGYDGIAHPPIIFPHQPSFFHFLECLESSLSPQGCLEPPLWFLKTQTKKNKRVKEGEGEGGEWWEGVGVWNQAFRVRGVKREEEVKKKDGTASVVQAALPHHLGTCMSESSLAPPPPLPLPLSLPFITDSSSDTESETEVMTAFDRAGSLARKDWEKFQSKVSQQLLARYFYSWLSYCRHMSRVRAKVSHMVEAGCHTPSTGPASLYPAGLTDELWAEFTDSNDHKRKWQEVLQAVYQGGMPHHLRSKVWPYLLGLYPVSSTAEEREAIDRERAQTYQSVVSEWREAELTAKRVESQRPKGPHMSAWAAKLVQQTKEEEEDVGVLDKEVVSITIDLDPVLTTSPSGSSPTLSVDSGPTSSCSPTAEDRHTGTGEHQFVMDGKSDSPTVNGWSSSGTSPVVHRKEEEEEEREEREEEREEEEEEEEEEENKLVLAFADELVKIDKDIPRCDRDYPFFQEEANRISLRNIISSYVWANMDIGYSQGMCDLLAPILVVMKGEGEGEEEGEALAHACFLWLMSLAIELFPPNSAMSTRLANLLALLEVLEPEFYQYLSERPMGDSLFYCYRWFLVGFKREFSYTDIFRLWETTWAARLSVSRNFDEFFALAIMQHFKTGIMDAHLDPSDILSLFTDIADRKTIDCSSTIAAAQLLIAQLQQVVKRED